MQRTAVATSLVLLTIMLTAFVPGAVLAHPLSAAGQRLPPPSEDQVSGPPEEIALPTVDQPTPIQIVLRDRGAGGVTVEAIWLGWNQDRSFAFRLVLHSDTVDLSGYEFTGNLSVKDHAGRETRAAAWEEWETSASRRSGIVTFPASALPEPVISVTSFVRELTGLPPRALMFDFVR